MFCNTLQPVMIWTLLTSWAGCWSAHWRGPTDPILFHLDGVLNLESIGLLEWTCMARSPALVCFRGSLTLSPTLSISQHSGIYLPFGLENWRLSQKLPSALYFLLKIPKKKKKNLTVKDASLLLEIESRICGSD